MVKSALDHRGNATWFVFIEADTYLVWPNLLEYLYNFHSGDALHLGNTMFIQNKPFDHGGSSCIHSNSAVQKVVRDRDAHLFEYDQLTVRERAGDAVLAQKLKKVGVPLIWASPHFAEETPSTIDFNATGASLKPWCYAPVTYHHMRVHEIRQLYDFEQNWRRKNGSKLLYSEISKGYIQPKLAAAQEDWDNLSKELKLIRDPIPTNPSEECLAVCEAVSKCLQYSYLSGDCYIASQIRHGKKTDAGGAAVQSGWMTDRIARFTDAMNQSCHSLKDAPWHV